MGQAAVVAAPGQVRADQVSGRRRACTTGVEGGPCGQAASATAMLLIPDLGTAPVSRYRNALRRLLALRTVHRESGSTAREPGWSSRLQILTDGRTRAAPGRSSSIESLGVG